MIVPVVVEDQSLRWYGRPPKIADDSIEFVRFQFHLPEDWDPLVLVAQFTQADTYNMLLDGDMCFLPKELTAGLCKLSLFGYAEGKPLRATSIPLVFQIEESGFVSSAETPIPPTPDLYAQLIEYFSNIAGSDGEGSGSKILFVDITKDENKEYHSSHSASEIKEHLENGDFVCGRYGAKTLVIEEITEEYVSFVYHKPGGSSSDIYRVFDDETVLFLSASHRHSEMISTTTTQSFSNAQKSQARENIGAMSKDDVIEVVNEALKDVDGSAVLHSPQKLTEEQKSQARENIGLENAVMGMLIELGIAPVLLDNDGKVLVDSDDVILLNK